MCWARFGDSNLYPRADGNLSSFARSLRARSKYLKSICFAGKNLKNAICAWRLLSRNPVQRCKQIATAIYSKAGASSSYCRGTRAFQIVLICGSCGCFSPVSRLAGNNLKVKKIFGSLRILQVAYIADRTRSRISRTHEVAYFADSHLCRSRISRT